MRSLYTADRLVENTDDMAGLKVRVQPSAASVNMIEALGGTATPMGYGEVYTALQPGIIDAAENNLTSLVSSRHGEVADYWIYTEHTVVPDMFIMNNGGIVFRLINFAKVLVGRMPGSLAHTNVVGNMLFGSIAGSSVASAAAMGRIMGPLQKNSGYDKKYSAAVNIASAPAGLIIPPTTILIVYSLVSGGTSIAALFIAGYIPGILWGLTKMVIAYIFAKKYKYPVADKISWRDKAYLTVEAIPSLLLIIIVIGGIVAGIFTATEGAAIAVVYSTVLSIIYKSLKAGDFPQIMKETVEITGMILLLITASGLFSLVMSYTGLPAAMSEGLLSITDNPIFILLLMTVFLLAIGTFMDITPAVLIFTPISCRSRWI